MPDKPDHHLGRAIAKGAMWTVGSRMAVRSLGLISIIVLARILVPDDFGVVARASMIYSFLELCTQFGLDSALIKNQDADRWDYDTAWTIHVIRGFFIATTLIALARPAAMFFNDPGLDLIIYIFAVVSIINGFQNIGIVDFRRNLTFHLEFRFIAWHKLVGFIAAILTAIVWRSYWAFLAGIVAGSITSLMLSYHFSQYRPRFSLSRLHTMFGFSKWMLIHEISSAIAWRLDSFILARFSTSQVLGVYTVANEIASTPTTEISMPAARAMMPGLAKADKTRAGFSQLFGSTLTIVLFIAVPAGLGLSAISDTITLVLLGANWMDASPLIRILALSGIIAVMYSCSISAFIAFDRIDLVAKLSVARLVLRLIVMPVGYYYFNVLGVALAVLASGLAHMILTMTALHMLNMICITRLLRQSWRILAASGLMYAGVSTIPVAVLRLFIGQEVFVMLSLILVGATIYALVLFALWHASGRPDGPENEIFRLIRSRRS